MAKNTRVIALSTYSLKSRFQALLVPVRDRLIALNFSANQTTLLTAFLCIVYAALLVWPPTAMISLILLPIFLFIRMALNALDGMIASHTRTKSPLGVVLNEVGDVVSDFCLFGAFVFLLPPPPWPWLALMVLGFMIEFVSLAMFLAIGERPNSGPFAKSDRALYLGLLSLILIAFPGSTFLIEIFVGVGVLLALVTLWNRSKLIAQETC
jgi:CDP-diacylglycerol--glycerol-3-phosphate 3-phosphatidyltransferase